MTQPETVTVESPPHAQNGAGDTGVIDVVVKPETARMMDELRARREHIMMYVRDKEAENMIAQYARIGIEHVLERTMNGLVTEGLPQETVDFLNALPGQPHLDWSSEEQAVKIRYTKSAPASA